MKTRAYKNLNNDVGRSGLSYSQIKRRVANFDDRRWADKRFAIFNEFGLIAIVYADHDQDALDAAADSGHMDCQAMEPADYAEYSSNGWDDSYDLLGNAGEPFWTEYLSISEIA